MKKVAIMQPYFFPYLGYFSLIKHTDEYILFDTVQFMRHGWIERNRILKQDGSWIYIKVPLKRHDRETLIKDVEIDNSQTWAGKILAQLTVYKKSAPNYHQVISLVKEVLAEEHEDIVSLNRRCIEAVCEYLGINADIKTFSKMKISVEKPNASDEWALNICKALGGVDEYWNSPNGIAFFDRTKYEEAGIELKFQKIIIDPYDQHTQEFQPGLSIIDVMMFNSSEEINKMLDNYEFI